MVSPTCCGWLWGSGWTDPDRGGEPCHAGGAGRPSGLGHAELSAAPGTALSRSEYSLIV